MHISHCMVSVKIDTERRMIFLNIAHSHSDLTKILNNGSPPRRCMLCDRPLEGSVFVWMLHETPLLLL